MSVTDIKAEELRQKGGEEGIVFQGCGGDVKDWVDGVNQLLKDEKILLGGTKLAECYRFENGGLTNLYFPFGSAKLDMGKFAIWRLKAREVFGVCGFRTTLIITSAGLSLNLRNKRKHKNNKNFNGINRAYGDEKISLIGL